MRLSANTSRTPRLPLIISLLNTTCRCAQFYASDTQILTPRQVLHYEGYGKEYVKKFKMSPDAWVQLVKQLAFHKMFGRPGVCYESAQTRKYQLGRTEVIRSASNETKAWAEAMSNPRETVSDIQLFG